MKAKDLRLGNWVCDEVEVFQVSWINMDFVFDEKFSDGVELTHIKPVPLTEEWFLNFGFKKEGDYFIISRLDIDYCFKHRGFKDDYTFYVEYTDSGDPNDDGKKYPITFQIEFVHQLQNVIHFASLGIDQVELKIRQ